MFFENQTVADKEKYELLLKVIGSLSRLSSDNDIPYLYYRMAENIFCDAFDATNLGRSDISLDAKKGLVGLGLKTFISNNGSSVEKIAEFNKNKNLIDKESSEIDRIKLIAKMRNERLEATAGICGLSKDNMFYHCVARTKGKLLLSETQMDLINITDINIVRKTDNIVSFSDRMNYYNFNFTKSTLYKKFIVNPIREFEINILDNPFQLLVDTMPLSLGRHHSINQVAQTVYLPLYSIKNGEKTIPQRSGLNQWNSKGRIRNFNEAYISIPAFVHRKFPDFFPARNTSFSLKFPDGSVCPAKVCQDGSKALMTDPNSALGGWILRSVLRLHPGDGPVSYEQLEQIGIDCVEINKFSDGTFAINFKELGVFEKFKNNLSVGQYYSDSE